MAAQPQKIVPRTEGRSATNGFFQMPNSLVENLDLFTPSEVLFVLCLHRRGGDCTLSDRTWEDWTGMTPRMKDHAIKGLKNKGLKCQGLGSGAKYQFDKDQWNRWMSAQPRRQKAHTAGRSKSVTAKAGMQVHPECQEHGCQKLCEDPPKGQVISISSAIATQVEKQVSQVESPPPKTSPPPRPTFPLTTAAIQKHFPAADSEFVTKLRAVVQDQKYTDSQLAEAVHAAHKRNQHSEGLYLRTVPGALRVVCSRPSAPTAVPSLSPEAIKAAINRNAAALRKAGYADIADQLSGLDTGDFDQLENSLTDIEGALIERLYQTTKLSAALQAELEKELKPYRAKMSATQLARLEQQFTERKLLEAAGLPRLSLFYLI